MSVIIDKLTQHGTHFVTEPIYLTSGSSLIAEPHARIVGGKRLTRLRQLDDKVFVCDLTEEGITPARMRSRGFGRTPVPAHNELFINSRPLNISCYPKKGEFLRITGYGEERVDEWNSTNGQLGGGFYYDDERPKMWKPNDNIWVHGYWSWDWANTYEHIASIDKDKMFIHTHPPYGMYQYKIGQRFYFLNIPEEVTDPGDYCIDYENNLLYFIPFNQNLDEVILSVSDTPAFIMDGVEDVYIDGFSIAAYRGNAVRIHNSSDVVINNCEFRNIGNTAVTVTDSADILIENSYIHDVGDGGINVRCGDRKTLTPANVKIRGCTFSNIAKWSRCYQPAISLYGVGLTAKCNIIHDCPHSAVIYGGNDISVTNNEIYRVVMETGDAGAIYSGRNYTYRGNNISHNFIHHLGSSVGMGTMGIYNDDNLSGTHMEGNIFYRVNRAVFLGGGRDFVVKNNIFIDCTPSVEIDGRGTDNNPVWVKMVNEFMRDNFYKIEDDISGIDPIYTAKYPELLDIHNYYCEADKNNCPAKIPPSASIFNNILCSERKIEYTWSTDGGEFDEHDNIEINHDELEEHMPPAQYAKFCEIKNWKW